MALYTFRIWVEEETAFRPPNKPHHPRAEMEARMVNRITRALDRMWTFDGIRAKLATFTRTSGEKEKL